jgi:acyl carrier protein
MGVDLNEVGTMQNVEDDIRGYIADKILFSGNRYPYPDDASFLNEGIIDSMNILELILFVEDRFHVRPTDEEITPDNFDSVTRLANYIRSKIAVPS